MSRNAKLIGWGLFAVIVLSTIMLVMTLNELDRGRVTFPQTVDDLGVPDQVITALSQTGTANRLYQLQTGTVVVP